MTYVSIRQVMDDILNHPLLTDLSFERAVNYALQFLQIVGMPPAFKDKTEYIEIKNYRGVLPCDFYEMIQVRHKDRTFRYSTDSFHYSDNKSKIRELTYKLQGNCIFTSLKDGIIEIAYLAIAVDDEGYPLIPENAAYINALENYIKVQLFTVLFDLGKISQQSLLNAQLEYAWSVGLAQTSLVNPSIDQMESLTNGWVTLIPRTNEHRKGFVTNGTYERLKIH